MMLAEVTNFSPPEQIAAWIACAAFAAWFFLLVDKGVARLRGDKPFPPNSQLESDQRDLKRRVKTLEDWKESLMQKLDDDKSEIIKAGESREAKLTQEINSVKAELNKKHDVNSTRLNSMDHSLGGVENAVSTQTDRISELEKTVNGLPSRIIADLRNAKGLLE